MKEGPPSNMKYNILYWLFLPTILYYALMVCHDLSTNWFLFLTLLSITSVFPPVRHKKLHIVLALSATIDFLVKVLMVSGFIGQLDSTLIDLRAINNFANFPSESIQLGSLLYILALVLSWSLVATFNIRNKSRTQTFEQFKLFEFLSTSLNYITPILLYVLCYSKVTNNNSFRDWLEHLSPELTEIQFGQIQMFEQVAWSLLTASCLTTGKENASVRRWMTVGSIILIIRDQQMESISPDTTLYLLKWKIVAAIKISLLVCWRTHNLYSRYIQKLEEFEDSIERQAESRMSSHMRFVNRKKLSQMQTMNHYLVLLLLSLTIFAVVLTNGLGNIIIILAVGLNFPVYQEKRFRLWVAVGAIISVMLQPSQFVYFIFLYLIRLFRTHDEEYPRKNWWIVMELGRIIILLSKVSLLTFLIGLFQSETLVLVTLIFRTVCSYYGSIIVFMGTEDAYSYYIEDIIPKSIGIDLILWTYFLLRKIYSPSSSIKFSNTKIINIFEEYAIINYFQKGLKVLKVFHWIAYITISFFILNNTPSLFTLMRIIPLVLVFIVGILDSHRSKVAYNLWHWNFYTALGIAFIKYFYLLSRYSNLSSWLVSILEPLITHHKFIGLTPPDNTSLLVSFGPDFLLIVINAIMIFVIRVQLSEVQYQQAKRRIYQEEGLSENLLAEKDDSESKSIHYLYKNYIKSVDIRFNQKSVLRVIFTDYIMDLCFLFFLIIICLFHGHQDKAYYLLHFILFFYGFWRQKGKHYPLHLFNWLVFICSVDLLFIYLRYFFSMIMGSEVSYRTSTVISKYLLVMVTVIFKQISVSLQNFYRDIPSAHRQHNFLLFQMLTPQIKDPIFRKEVIVLYFHWNRIFSFAVFIAMLLAHSGTVRTIHLWTIIAMVAQIFLSPQNRKEMFKRYWMYYMLAAILTDLWFGYLSAIFCLITLRGYYMFLEEFDLELFVEVYERSNRTDNEETRQKIQEEEKKMEEKYHFPQKDRLSVISQVGREESSSEKLNISINWEYKNTYTSIVWLLPLMFMFVTALGALFYDVGYYGFVIFGISFIAIVISLKDIFNFTAKTKSIKFLMILVTGVVIFSTVDKQILEISDFSKLNCFGFGLFLLFLGLFGYFELLVYNDRPHSNMNLHYSYHIDFCEKRSLQAMQYWRLKCQMVSQLGSQIHNEKKMSNLKTFFLHRQNLSVKVEHLQNQLKYRSQHRRTQFRNLEKLEKEAEEELKKVDFEVYSNMLTFMSLQDLEFCYLDLNQFFNGQVKEQNDLPRAIRNVKEWVIRNFEGTIRQTLEKYKNQLEAYNKDLQVIKVLPVIEEDHFELQSPMKEQKRSKEESPLQQQLEKVQKQLHEIEMEKIDSQVKQYKTPQKLKQQKQAQDCKFLDELESSKDHMIQNKQSVLKKKQSLLAILNLCSTEKRDSDRESKKEVFKERIDQRLHEHNWLSRKLIQNIEIIGLIVTAGWNFFGGVYTIPTNIAIFSWAMVLETKTTVAFWMFLMIYSFCVAACKLVLEYLPTHFFFNFLFYYHAHDYIYEFIIIFVAAVEIIFLKMGGTSQIAYSQRQNIFDAFYRNLLNQAANGKEQQGQEQFIKVYKKMRHAHKHSFFHRVFSKGRIKPGKDFYPLLAIVQVIILFYIFFFYDQMEFQSKNNRKSLGQLLTVSQFSKNMILALFFQVIIMVVDRVIVALNIIDRLNQRLQNFFFSFAFKHTPKYMSLEAKELSSLGKFDYLLIIKYVFHVILLLSINFFVYFYIPSGGLEKSIIPQCEMSVCGKSYNYLSFFLLLYLIYFVISGLQIKHGFNRNKCRNTLMESYHWIDYYIYMFFTGMPFLWEFKKISDWTTTATALPLFHWMKFQDINARMYRSKCQAEILKQKELGKKAWYKPIVGPIGYWFIIGIIFSPFIMYSSFNPFAVTDSIIAASSELTLILNDNIQYKFFQTSHTNIHHHDDLNQKYKLLGFFDRADLYKLETSSYPDQDFSLSEPAIDQLCDKLYQAAVNDSSDKFAFRLKMEISERVGGDSEIVWGSKELSADELMEIYLAINSNQTEMFKISNFYSPFPGQIANQSIYIYNRNNVQYFEVKTDSMQAPGDPNKTKGIFIFYKSSVKYNVAFGLLTFYLTYVVLINSLFRVYLTGGLETIIFQGPQLQKILFLCEAVRSARILQNFYQQQYLYFSLVDLMRHPRMIHDIADDFVPLRKQQHIKLD